MENKKQPGKESIAENTIPIEATPQKYVRKIQGDTTKMLTDHTTMEQK